MSRKRRLEDVKKALVAALVLTFVLSIAATASAAVLTPASFPDVQGQACADAVAKLEALGIAKGIDGKWMPELPVTRAQFAAFAVRLVGLEKVAGYMKGATKFADVPADHWASGYINVAVAKKLVLGLPDGTFRPEEPITFAQAATMLGRALGYVNLPGDWPGNYMIVASEKNLFAGVTFTAGDVVNRGDMAIMLANALGAKRVEMKLVGEGIWTYEDVTDPAKDTLLESAFSSSADYKFVVENADVNALLKPQEVRFRGDSTIYTMPAGVNTAGLLGHKVAVVASGTAVKFVEDVTPAAAIVSGTVYAATANDVTLTVNGINVTKTFAATKYIYRNKVTAAYSELQAGDTATVLLDDAGSALVVSAFKLNYSDALVEAVTVKGVAGATADTVKVEGMTSAVEVASNATILKNGNPAGIGDVKVGDVAYVAVAGGKVVYLAAYDKTVEGVVSNVLMKSDGKTYLVMADGTEYKLSDNVAITVDSTTGGSAVAGQLIGLKVKVLLNKENQARKVTAAAGILVGRVAEDYTTGQAVLKVNVKGTVVSVPVPSTVSIGSFAVNDLVVVATKADGSAKSATKITASGTGTVAAVNAAGRTVTLQVGAAYNLYNVSADAAIYTTVYAPIELGALKVGSTVEFYQATAGQPLLYLRVTAPPAATVAWVQGKYLGYLVDYGTGDVTLYLEVGGASKSYLWKGGSDKIAQLAGFNDANEEFVSAKTQTSDTVTEVVYDAVYGLQMAELSADIPGATVVSINDNGTITLKKNSTYYVLGTANAAVYAQTTSATGAVQYVAKTLADVTVNATVDVFYLVKSLDGTIDNTKIGVLVIK
jgi:hypothetical protein